jgi:hypothetical protein
VNVDGNLVGHRPRRAKEPGFHPKLFGQSSFQAQDRGVVAQDIVANRSALHGV